MEYENICKFIPGKGVSGELTVLNFVHERRCDDVKLRTGYGYTTGIAVKGRGRLFNDGREYELKTGDLFFTLPSKEYRFESIDGFEYIYVTFVGARASALMERAHISTDRAVVYGQDELLPIWTQALDTANDKNIDLLAESVLLYSFALVSAVFEEKLKNKGDIDIILQVKEYIDSNFDDPELSLKTVAERFMYNDKYISEKFRRTVRTGFSDYIRRLRMERAVKLIEGGMRNVSDIAKLCGYTDPFYFSKVFKLDIGVSPKKYIEGERK